MKEEPACVGLLAFPVFSLPKVCQTALGKQLLGPISIFFFTSIQVVIVLHTHLSTNLTTASPYITIGLALWS